MSPYDLFVVIPGTHCDGEAFLRDALDKGAAAVASEHRLNIEVPNLIVPNARRAAAELAAAFYDHPTRELCAIGVTGTNGKTTVCHWIAELLGAASSQLISTVTNPESGLSNLTTPPSSIIQKQARLAVERGKRHFIVEASSAGIAQERLGCIQFDIGAFTNLTPEHLQHHGSVEAYRCAKLKLFTELSPHSCAVLNADDALSERIATETPARVFAVGKAEGANLRLRHTEWTPHACRFVVAFEGKDHVVDIPSGGEHSISNGLVALGVGVVAGVSLPQLIARLSAVRAIPGRGEAYVHADGRCAVVDFAHNAGALKELLRTHANESGRRILVFGCPGDGELPRRPISSS